MSDLRWLQHVEAFCRAWGLNVSDTMSRIRRRKTYNLAYRQFCEGASDRVIDMLLERQCRESGLIA